MVPFSSPRILSKRSYSPRVFLPGSGLSPHTLPHHLLGRLLPNLPPLPQPHLCFQSLTSSPQGKCYSHLELNTPKLNSFFPQVASSLGFHVYYGITIFKTLVSRLILFFSHRTHIKLVVKSQWPHCCSLSQSSIRLLLPSLDSH